MQLSIHKNIAGIVILLLHYTSCQNPDDHHVHTNHSDSAMYAIEPYLFEVINPVNEVVVSNQSSLKPKIINAQNVLSAEGYISFDERRNNIFSTRFAGRIEKLYVKYNFQYIKKGEAVMELYSPQINTIMAEYLHHLKNPSDSFLMAETRKKLLLLGLTEKQISDLEKKEIVPGTITVYSPFEGYVLFNTLTNPGKMPEKNIREKGPMEMPTENETVFQQTISIKEGSYVNEGQSLFMVNDFKEVWAIVAFPAKDELNVRLNSSVMIFSNHLSAPLKGVINFIEPFYSEEQKYTQARIYLKNEKMLLRLNTLVMAGFPVESSAFSIPLTSVLDLGRRKMVWKKTGQTKAGSNLFKAQQVITGDEINGYVEIISGLSENDEVAKDAAFMIDSESLVRIDQQ